MSFPINCKKFKMCLRGKNKEEKINRKWGKRMYCLYWGEIEKESGGMDWNKEFF
jgi:hypothetical protein